jgi:antitoxin PrlF
MRELTSTVTTKGQVTIPVEIRRLLKVAARDRVAFIVERDQVRLVRTESVAQRTAGALKSDEPALSPQQEREAAERAFAVEAEPRSGA